MMTFPTGRAPLVAVVLCLAMAFGLSACGKKGSPEAPGPENQITYPRNYPTQ
ncbi:MAG: hypothetical protein ACRYGI_03960 [Janthinobacterium lividum]